MAPSEDAWSDIVACSLPASIRSMSRVKPCEYKRVASLSSNSNTRHLMAVGSSAHREAQRTAMPSLRDR